jgi:intergrase/recombinase
MEAPSMARQNPPRRVYSEANLALRIKHEREARTPTWSYVTTAERLRDIGCPIQSSAIFRLEKGERKITVDELVAFAMIFETTPDELLRPLDVVLEESAKRQVDELALSLVDLTSATNRTYRALVALAETEASASEERRNALRQVLDSIKPEAPDPFVGEERRFAARLRKLAREEVEISQAST